MDKQIIYHAVCRDQRWPEQVVVLRVIREHGKQVDSVAVAWHKNERLALTDMRARNAIQWDACA